MPHDTVLDRKTDSRTKRPRKYHVIMLNDDFTPMEFVVDVLTEVFGHGVEEANRIMLAVHNEGKAIAGTYPFEIAEQKSLETQVRAVKAQHPLQTVVEPEA